MADCSLYFEIWDSDTTGDGDFLGSLQLNGEHLKLLVETSRYHPRWFQLVKSKHLPKSTQDLVQGELEIRVGDISSMAKMAENAQKFELEVIAASNLARADGMFGLSDPIVKWNYIDWAVPPISPKLSTLCGTAATLSASSAAWTSSKMTTPMPAMVLQRRGHYWDLNHLQVDVWDYDMIGNGKFLGCAIITGEDLDNCSAHLSTRRDRTSSLAWPNPRGKSEGGIT